MRDGRGCPRGLLPRFGDGHDNRASTRRRALSLFEELQGEQVVSSKIEAYRYVPAGIKFYRAGTSAQKGVPKASFYLSQGQTRPATAASVGAGNPATRLIISGQVVLHIGSIFDGPRNEIRLQARRITGRGTGIAKMSSAWMSHRKAGTKSMPRGSLADSRPRPTCVSDRS